MFELKTKDLLTGGELSKIELFELLTLASELKHRRKNGGQSHPYLAGKTLALLFDKPSLRTRMSFFVAMQELGGSVVESVSASRKDELPQDLARVLSGYCHAVMVRTFDDSHVKKMSEYSSIPIINGLTDNFHPCQTLADLLTLKETFGTLSGLKIAYIGDGNNTLQSFFPILDKTGIELHYACPKGYGPSDEIKSQFSGIHRPHEHESPWDAVEGADVVYTDVWASMGFEAEAVKREKAFVGFQVNKDLLKSSGKKPKLMHCLPMIRGKEISSELPDSEDSLIFKQSENRLHVQKALLVGLMSSEKNVNYGVNYGKAEEKICG